MTSTNKPYDLKITQDGYDLKITGTIQPVKAVDEMDFSRVYDYFIKAGYSEKEAHKLTVEFVTELVEEIRKEGDMVE